ncbi:hypothetical protein L3Y34_016469 [Caenorhabditis briggsae]|uniref:non-specific serine/threonine protein kinase n=1 Tax=Caenorhabditis briggsae TaxID=6238 RepID=A0AAE9DZC0_CAEBR|nr:hypothetical protein L3Y34_016469 [Caenorhabditis briggsae]
MYKMSNDDEDGTCRYFMEYVDSGNLFERIQENSENGFSDKLALKFYRQLVFGLEHIHGMGIAHLDIRPENLMLTGDEILKISDFGLSVRFKDENGISSLVEPSGSALYRSPECRKCALIDGPKSDIFSSGVVLVEMLNGPWEEATETDENYKKWIDGIENMGWKNAGELVMAFLRKILTDDPEKRAKIQEIKSDGWFQESYSNPENSRKRKIAENEQQEKRTRLYLSECSKLAFNVARLKNMKEFGLEIASSSTQILIIGPDFKEAVGFTFKKSRSMNSIRYLPSENPDKDFPDLLKKILEVFGISQVLYFFTNDSNFQLFVSISEILIQRQCKVATLHFWLKHVEDKKKLKYILDNLRISELLRFHSDVKLSSNFEYIPGNYPKVLSVENSSWFGLNQLFSAVKSSLKVTISKSSLTIHDLNEFLGKWIAGEIQNMTAFSISITSKNFIGDSPVLGMKQPIIGTRNWRINHGVICAKVQFGRLIKNINGEEAVIELMYNRFLFLASS